MLESNQELSSIKLLSNLKPGNLDRIIRPPNVIQNTVRNPVSIHNLERKDRCETLMLSRRMEFGFQLPHWAVHKLHFYYIKSSLLALAKKKNIQK